MCCVYSGYHAVISHVKMNHDTFATDNQRMKLSIRSAQKTWSVFADAFSASAHEFWICTPRFSFVAIINWHLNYKGPKCIEFLDGTVQVQEGQNQETDPSVLSWRTCRIKFEPQHCGARSSRIRGIPRWRWAIPNFLYLIKTIELLWECWIILE